MRTDQKFYTKFILGIVGLFIFYSTLLLPSTKGCWQVVNNIIQSSRIQEQGQDLEIEIKGIEERNNYYTQQIGLFRTQLCDLTSLSDFYRTIIQWAKESNLHILALSPTTLGIDTTLEWLRIQINFSSGFLAVMRFIAKVEELGILIQITELSLSKNRIDQSWIEGRIILSIHRLDL